MSLKSMHDNWAMWSEIAFDDDQDLNEPCKSVPQGAVQAKYANAGWVPFAGDSQHYIAIDFAPGPSGTNAQIISSGRDDEIRYLIAPDIPSFFDFVVKQFRSGIVSAIPAEGDASSSWLRVGESQDLLTALPQLRGFG